MELTTNTLSILPGTKQEIASFAKKAKSEILNGQIDFKKLLYQKACIEKTLEAIFVDEEIKKHIEGEIEKYGKGGLGFYDATFEVQSKKSWSYDKTGDNEVAIYEQEKKSAEASLKERQKFLQTLLKPIEIVNSDTGEVETIYPAAYTETTYIKTTFKK